MSVWVEEYMSSEGVALRLLFLNRSLHSPSTVLSASSFSFGRDDIKWWLVGFGGGKRLVDYYIECYTKIGGEEVFIRVDELMGE